MKSRRLDGPDTDDGQAPFIHYLRAGAAAAIQMEKNQSLILGVRIREPPFLSIMTSQSKRALGQIQRDKCLSKIMVQSSITMDGKAKGSASMKNCASVLCHSTCKMSVVICY